MLLAAGALLGLLSPFCSCSALPTAISLSSAGASPSAVVAFVASWQQPWGALTIPCFAIHGVPGFVLSFDIICTCVLVWGPTNYWSRLGEGASMVEGGFYWVC